MHTKLLSACIAGLILHGHAAARDIKTLDVDGEVVVSNAGTVDSHAIHTPLPDEMHAVINKAVASWKFEPSSAPAPTRSKMRVTLSATPDAAQHVVKVEDVVFRDVVADASRAAPRTPAEVETLVRPKMPGFPVDGVVNVAMRVAPDGRVLAAEATQCSVHASGGIGRDKARACRILETHGVNAVKQWVLAPQDRTSEWTAMVPLHFAGVNKTIDATPGQWRKEYRTAYRAPDWHPPEEGMLRLGAVDARGKSVMPIESELRMLHGALEHTL